MTDLKILPSKIADIDFIMDIIHDAKTFLKNFNSPQWQDSYPEKELIIRDIANKSHYSLFVDEVLAGIMTVIDYDDNYDIVYDGAFSDLTYYAIHRIAIKKEYRNQGLAKKMIDYVVALCTEKSISSIRIDTHELNIPMQKMLIKAGFKYVGIIFLKNPNDNLRLAYEKIII